MILDKKHYHFINLLVIITFVTGILIISSSELSFAKRYDENKRDDRYLQDTSNSPIKKTYENKNGEAGQIVLHNDELINQYYRQYYTCGNPN